MEKMMVYRVAIRLLEAENDPGRDRQLSWTASKNQALIGTGSQAVWADSVVQEMLLFCKRIALQGDLGVLNDRHFNKQYCDCNHIARFSKLLPL